MVKVRPLDVSYMRKNLKYLLGGLRQSLSTKPWLYWNSQRFTCLPLPPEG